MGHWRSLALVWQVQRLIDLIRVVEARGLPVIIVIRTLIIQILILVELGHAALLHSKVQFELCGGQVVVVPLLSLILPGY